MLNEFFLIQLLSTATLFFFVTATNIFTMWYLGGIYLFLLGFLLLLENADIFVGFLWVIDLGVGLIFFIFILHFSNFLHQKTYFDHSTRSLLFFVFTAVFLGFFFFFATPSVAVNYNYNLAKIWFFFISWYNYYTFFASFQVTELNLLRELFFYNNSFGFFIVNFMLFYGVVAALLLCFLIRKFFNFLNAHQTQLREFATKADTGFFIRNQNFLRQQTTGAGVRVWLKKKNNRL